MDYIRDININEAVIHILDANAEEPILNEHKLELSDEIYEYLYKHIEKCFKDEELKYGIFTEEESEFKNLAKDFLGGQISLLDLSKKISEELFDIMREDKSILPCDLMVVSISTEYGPMLGILKMDYIKNYMHTVDFIDNKIDINIIPQFTGLPSGSQRLQKCAFIRSTEKEDKYNLMLIDKKSETDYFTSKFIYCETINNERDITKTFLKATEKWTQKNLKENADAQEAVRSAIKKKLRDEEVIDVKNLSEDIFKDAKEVQDNFTQYIIEQGVNNEVAVDKEWVDKKLSRVRLKIDKDIDLYINEEAYGDDSRFQIQRNGDGSINMIIKHIKNYMEK